MKNVSKIILLLACSLVVVLCFTRPAKAEEPTLTAVLEHLGFTNTELVTTADVTFPAGKYNVTLYAEFAAYNIYNQLSYYEVGTSTYNLIFDGPEGGSGYLSTPITKTITVDHSFALSMFVSHEDHRYFTENTLNPDGQNHSRVYKNLNDPMMQLVGFENLYGAGDRDYQDLVFSVQRQSPDIVVPEVPFGAIMTIASMIIALAGFVGFKRLRPNSRYNTKTDKIQ